MHLEYAGLLEESIAHWDRMVAWMKKQKHYYDPDTDDMRDAIGEHWYGDHCPCCKHAQSLSGRNDFCVDCPIVIAGFKNCQEVGNPWLSVAESETNEEWLNNADKMILFLEEVKQYWMDYEQKDKDRVCEVE